MGRDVEADRYFKHHFEQFSARLEAETELLQQWFTQGGLAEEGGSIGFELEGWLISPRGEPTPLNQHFLQQVRQLDCTPELSRFNIEINSPPIPPSPRLLTELQQQLEQRWSLCQETAGRLGVGLIMIGTLPTLRTEMLTLETMSQPGRYHALNRELMRLRRGAPFQFHLHGEEQLSFYHPDVMLEAATTSLQIHLQTPFALGSATYNALLLASGPVVAVAANSPLLFGRRLWQESRIPLFEQAVAVGGLKDGGVSPMGRVTFGSGFVRSSVYELFVENREHYLPLLPAELAPDPQKMEHLSLHNGTIWRWNRPIIGFASNGQPHLRFEHRTLPAGPTPVDSVANIAFLLGLVAALTAKLVRGEVLLSFAQARDNFYGAARLGLDAHLQWQGGEQGRAGDLLPRLLPLAADGLRRMGLLEADIATYLDIIAARIATGQNGANWQLRQLTRIEQRQRDPQQAGSELVQRYFQWQESGQAVHQWEIE
ncbi:MAG: glutamate--cysteine ligase [Gammaproteobacteria bacterium]|nr:glutamate--cysteine ligase [Gammaproteobacteria bacterium]